MDPDTVATFFAVLLLGGIVGLVAAWFVPAVRRELEPAAPTLAATIAVAATAGSLWFSESAGFVPCELCWYQRIAMYPLAVVLTMATIRRDAAIRPYAIVLAAIGAAISAYHVAIQQFPDQSSFCEASNPCSAAWVDALGWMTIPQMAGVSFLLIIALLTLSPPTPTPPRSESS